MAYIYIPQSRQRDAFHALIEAGFGFDSDGLQLTHETDDEGNPVLRGHMHKDDLFYTVKLFTMFDRDGVEPVARITCYAPVSVPDIPVYLIGYSAALYHTDIVVKHIRAVVDYLAQQRRDPIEAGR